MQTLESTLTSFKVPENVTFYDPTEDLKLEAEEAKRKAIERSGIPKHFLNADIAKCESSVLLWAEALKQGSAMSSLLLKGDVGRGKTYNACAAMLYLMPQYRCQFTTFDAILRSVKATFDRDETEEQVISRLSSVQILCIDDFGKAKPTEWSLPILFEIINNRWSNDKPTIYTTQYSGKALMNRLVVNGDIEYAKAIISRLGKSIVVEFTGKDRRLT